MVNFVAFEKDVSDEIATILSSDFNIDVTKTQFVPHSDDAAITFPNLDQKSQGTKIIETTVLYVDMRRSTELSLKHRSHTVAKLYSAFVRGMTRCADVFDGEVRGIIGDRVMILFNSENCFENAVSTAEMINTVCKHVINKHFTHNQVTFGIGIDYGRMLATKTGIRRHGSAQQSYRSLVWLGRPANIASKLTDIANKPEERTTLDKVMVGYNFGSGLKFYEEYPHLFVKNFTFNPLTGMMHHNSPAFKSFYMTTDNVVMREKTPPILMTKQVYDGFRAAKPDAIELKSGWLHKVNVTIPEYSGQIFGGDIIYKVFVKNNR
ncbi:MAG: adenylate/guanylate cyclase domain-containing protein [Lentisphaerota bacterium]